MKIKLKNLNVADNMSEETIAFTADVYVDGIKAFRAANHGRGGPNNYYPFSQEGKDLLEQSQAWAKSLPKKQVCLAEMTFVVPMDLDLCIAQLM